MVEEFGDWLQHECVSAAIEKQINQPLNEYFNLIAGTSTGSILALRDRLTEDVAHKVK